MKKIHELTPNQQQFADEHHDQVRRFLSHYRLSEAEFYDVVIFGYLLAVQEYLENRELEQYKFTTIAWKNMGNCVKNELTYRNRAKRKATLAPYNEDSGPYGLDALLPGRMEAMAESMDNQKQALRLLSYLTPAEKEVVYLKADGYTYREIGERLNLTHHGVDSRIQRMRRRLRSLALI